MIIRLKNVYSQVLEYDDEERRIFESLLTVLEMVEPPRGKKRGKYRPRRFYNSKDLTFFSGFIPHLRVALKRKGFRLRIKDARRTNKARWTSSDILPRGLSERDYQIEALAAARRHCRGIFFHPTGAGKFETAAMIIRNLRPKKTLYFIPGRALAEEGVSRLKERFNSSIVGLVGLGEFDPRRITIALPSTIWSRRGQDSVQSLLKQADLVIFDECHSIASPSDIHVWFSIACMCSNAYHRYGFSATPFSENPVGNYRLIAATGPVISKVEESKLIDDGYLAKPTVFIFETPRPKKKGPKQTRWTTWHSINNWAVVDNEPYNELLAQLIMTAADSGRTILCIVDRVRHGKNILTACIHKYNARPHEVKFVHGSSVNKEQVLEEFKSGKFPALIISPTGHQGLDIPSVDVVMIAGGGKSKNRLIQKFGRGLRPGETGKVDILDFRNRAHPWVSRHFVSRESVYMSRGYTINRVTYEEYEERLTGSSQR